MAKMKIEVEMLSAGHGDALLVTYGDVSSPSRMLIDAGPWYTYKAVIRRLLELPREERELELLVITHIDSDHIDGVIRLLYEDFDAHGISFKDIWFNGTRQLDAIATAEDALGAKQGEYLQALLTSRQLPWNVAFDGGPIVARPKEPVTLDSGARIRILSPTRIGLTELLLNWKSIIQSEGYTSGDTEEAIKRLGKDRRLKPLQDELDTLGEHDGRIDETQDRSLANGSSIAFVLEVGRKKVLFAGDAHADVLTESIKHFVKPGKKLKLQAFKLSHHGSLGNTSVELLEQIDCKHFLISSNGNYFAHPDKMCIQKIVDTVDNPHLWFNYATPHNSGWLEDSVGGRFTSHYPSGISFSR